MDLKKEIEILKSDLEIMTDDRDEFEARLNQAEILRGRTVELGIKLKQEKEELLNIVSILAKKSFRKEGARKYEDYSVASSLIDKTKEALEKFMQ